MSYKFLNILKKNKPFTYLRLIGIILISVSLLGILSMSIDKSKRNNIYDLENITISEISEFEGEPSDKIAIIGNINCLDGIIMPDNNQKVIKGSLMLSVKSLNTDKEQILIDWKNNAKFLLLTQDKESVAVDADIHSIDTYTDTSFIINNLNQNIIGDSIYIKYFDYNFVLDKTIWDGELIFKIRRSYLPVGEKIALISSLNSKGKIQLSNSYNKILLINQFINKSDYKSINILSIIFFITIILLGILLLFVPGKLSRIKLLRPTVFITRPSVHSEKKMTTSNTNKKLTKES